MEADHSAPGKTSDSPRKKSLRTRSSTQPLIGPLSPNQPACSTSNKSTASTDAAILRSVAQTADYRGIPLSLDALSLALNQADGTSGIAKRAQSSLSEAATFALALSAKLSMGRSTCHLVSDTLRSRALGILVTYQQFLVDLQTCGLLPSPSEDRPATTSEPCSA